MTTDAAPIDIKFALKKLSAHLTDEVRNPDRQGTFDMDDAREATVLAPFPELKNALDWLAEHVAVPWHDEDGKGQQAQFWRRVCAILAIGSGTVAVIFAIAQLAQDALHSPAPVWLLVVELVAATVSVATILAGHFLFQFQKRWINHRSRAERLRMLKFSTMVRLCCCDPRWIEWAQHGIQRAETEDADAWKQSGGIDPELPKASNCDPHSSTFKALVVYYQLKRIQFQANHFEQRADEYRRETLVKWEKLSIGIPILSVILVFLHGLAQWHWLAQWFHSPGWLEKAAIYLVAGAAILPVAGMAWNAWLAAFEHPRSASLFDAKCRELEHARGQLEIDKNSVHATCQRMWEIEKFLEEEHREWLRLLTPAKWFI